MLRPLTLTIDPAVAPRLRVGTVRAEPVVVAASGPALLAERDEIVRALVARGEGDLAPARTLYRAFGVDPTRTRPASEALLRRVLSGKPLPDISNAVDLANLCSLDFLLPIGLYDADRIEGEVTLRVGGDTESYPGIRKDEVRLHGRPVLADAAGPFGNPTSDSLRTSVTPQTRSLWMVLFAPADYPPARLDAHVATAQRRFDRHLR